jgi:hypothetical protein
MANLDISNSTMDVRSTQGKTWAFSGVYTDSAGAAVPLTRAAWVLRDGYDGTAVLSAGTADYITMGTAGDFSLSIPGTATAAITAGQYVHEVEWTTTTGEIVGSSGTWIVEREVVR